MLQVFFVRTIINSMKNTKRPRGAPKKEKPAVARFELRCTPDEKQRWEEAAAQSDKSLASWLKDLANEAALANEATASPRRGS